MGGPRVTALLVLSAILATACGQQQGNTPTGPDVSATNQPLASVVACNFTTVSNLTKTEFGASSDQARLAGDMKNAGAQTALATSIGYQLLGSIAGKYDGTQTSRSNAAALTVALLRCMNIGGAAIPDAIVFDTALGAHGAFGVKSSGDFGPVTSHDHAWLLEPPGTQTWGSLFPAGISTILAFGRPVSDPAGSFTPDVGKSGIFNWSTLPTFTFNDPGVVVGQCTVESQYLQHNPAGITAEVLGFVKPSCFNPSATLSERAPTSVGGRLLSLFAPTPAYASLLITTGSGGSRHTLSPFQVIGPTSVELTPLFTWKKSGNTVGVPFSQVQTPTYQIKSKGGTNWLQDFVLISIQAVGNNGVNVDMCNNWAYTNAQGVAWFPAAFFNKAGGYTVISVTTGTSSKPDATNNDLPIIPPGKSLVSPLVNVKNGTLATCKSYHQGDPVPDPMTDNPNGFKPVTP